MGSSRAVADETQEIKLFVSWRTRIMRQVSRTFDFNIHITCALPFDRCGISYYNIKNEDNNKEIEP